MNRGGYDVFMCHSTADKAVVETLAKRLKSEGVKPWLDKWNLVPGEPWQPEIENALRKCRSCAVFIGPASCGPWQNEEMRAAIVRRVDNREKFRVIPVLLPKSKSRLSDNLPAFLLAATWVDFRNGVDDTAALRALICGIRGVPPGEGADSGSVNEGQTKWVMTLRASVSDVDRQVAHEILQHLAKLAGDATLTIRKITAGSVIIEFEGTKAGAEKIRSLELNGLLKEVLGFEIESIRIIGVPVSDPAVFPADGSVTPIPESAKKPSTTVQRRVQQPEHVPPPLFDADYLRIPNTEQLLHTWSAGDRSVEERLFNLVLPDLRNLARALMRRERRDHTLEPTELLNEAYVRLQAVREQVESRAHFLFLASRIMRRLLIDHARARTNPEAVPLISSHDLPPGPADKLELAIAVDRLLDELQANHPEWCSIVELKYFGGLTDQETAEALGLRLRTVQRQFSNARRWLFERLNPSTSKT